MTEPKDVYTLSLRARKGLAQLVIDSEAENSEQLVAWLWKQPQVLDRMPGVAKLTRREICDWLGFPYDAAREVATEYAGEYSASRVRAAIKLLQRFGWRFDLQERPPRALPPDLMDSVGNGR